MSLYAFASRTAGCGIDNTSHSPHTYPEVTLTPSLTISTSDPGLKSPLGFNTALALIIEPWASKRFWSLSGLHSVQKGTVSFLKSLSLFCPRPLRAAGSLMSPYAPLPSSCEASSTASHCEAYGASFPYSSLPPLAPQLAFPDIWARACSFLHSQRSAPQTQDHPLPAECSPG